MLSYITRRLLLMIPTFFGTTFLVFMLLQVVPDGPFDQFLSALKAGNIAQGEAGGGGGSGGNNVKTEISTAELAKAKREFGLNRNAFVRYLIWLGVAKKETQYISKHPINKPYKFTIENLNEKISLQKWLLPTIDNDKFVVYESIEGTDFDFEDYINIDDIDLSRVGYIRSSGIGELYTYTIKKLTDSILLQQYLIAVPEGDEIIVYESTKGTNFDLEGYSLLSDINLENEDTWKKSEWHTININPYEVALFLSENLSL